MQGHGSGAVDCPTTHQYVIRRPAATTSSTGIRNTIFKYKKDNMKENKNRSGSRSNDSGRTENKGDRKQTSQPGAPNKSNRQTKGNDESGPERERGTKKGLTVFKK